MRNTIPLVLLLLTVLVSGCSDKEPVTFRVIESTPSDCTTRAESVHNRAVFTDKYSGPCYRPGELVTYEVDPVVYGSSRDTVTVHRTTTTYVYHPSWDAVIHYSAYLLAALFGFLVLRRYIDYRTELMRRRENRADKFATNHTDQ